MNIASERTCSTWTWPNAWEFPRQLNFGSRQSTNEYSVVSTCNACYGLHNKNQLTFSLTLKLIHSGWMEHSEVITREFLVWIRTWKRIQIHVRMDMCRIKLKFERLICRIFVSFCYSEKKRASDYMHVDMMIARMNRINLYKNVDEDATIFLSNSKKKYHEMFSTNFFPPYSIYSLESRKCSP